MKRIVNKQGKFNLIDDNGEIVYKSNWLDFLANIIKVMHLLNHLKVGIGLIRKVIYYLKMNGSNILNLL